MCSAFRWTSLVVGVLALIGATACDQVSGAQPHGRESVGVLRVCADPNNLPFSNDAQQGFENRLADLLAQHLGRRAVYTWWPQRRGFIRNTLNAHACDVVMGVPDDYELALTTRPYYTSTFVFVTRSGERRVASLDDAALRRLRIGVHVVGDDYSSVPPAQALARRGIIKNIHGYSIFGDYAQPNPPERLLAALAAREIDVAIAWGPLAGYFSRREAVPLELTPVPSERAGSPFRYAFAISMAVRRDDTSLRDSINRFLDERRAAVRDVLRAFSVPLVEGKV